MKSRIDSRLLPFLLAGMLLLVLITIPQMTVSADIGPKPSFNFKFDFSGLNSPPEDFEVFLYQCLDPDCNDREALPEVPGQYWECNQNGCVVDLLTGRDFWQVDMSLDGTTLSSQAFEKEGFYSTYSLVVEENQLVVKFVSSKEPSVGTTTEITTESGSTKQQYDMVVAAVLTLLVELPLAAIFLLLFKARFKNMLWILLGNLISIPAVWILVPLLPIDPILVVVFVLLTSSTTEAIILGVLGGEKISWVRAVAISLVINIASFIVGLFAFRY